MSRTEHCDVGIVGAGVAGLAAALELTRAGQAVRCLEANSRVGGRIYTIHDPFAPLPIELGAEFVHGRPSAIWDVIECAGLTAYERRSEALHLIRGRTTGKEKVGENADRLLSHACRHKDQTLAEFSGSYHQ